MNRLSFRNSAPYIVILSVALFLFHGIFARGFMSGPDNSFHYYTAYYLTRTLIPQYHWINGWSNECLAGFPVLVYYPQLGFLCIAFLNKVMFFPLNLAYKLMVLVSYAMFGAGLYKLLWHRFGRTASIVTCLCFMLQQNVYHEGILDGMWNHYFAIGLFFIFFHILDRHIDDITVKRSLILGLLLGIIILAHLFAAFFAFWLFFIYGIWYIQNMRHRKKYILKSVFLYALIPLTSCIVAAYYLHNVLIGQNYLEHTYDYSCTKDILTGLAWGIKAFFGPLEPGINTRSVIMNIPIAVRTLFSFIGAFIFFKAKMDTQKRRFLVSAVLFTLMAFIFFTDILSNLFSWWHRVPFLKSLETVTFRNYIHIGLYIFAAYGIAEFLRIFARKKQFVAISCVILLIILSYFHYKYVARDITRTLEQSPQMTNIYKTWDWVNKNIPTDGTRIIYQNTLEGMNDPILGRSDVFALSSIFTKVPQASISAYLESMPLRCDGKQIFGRNMSSADTEFISERMQKFNSGYIISVEPGLERKLDRSDLFLREGKFGLVAIYRLKNFRTNLVDFAKEAHYETKVFENQHIVFNIDNSSTNNHAIIKVFHHPLWRARLNGEYAELRRSPEGLISIIIPEEGHYKLQLSFDYFDIYSVSLSILGFAVCITIILRKKNEHIA